MNIKLIPAEFEDIETILKMQIISFAEMLEKYQDYDTSPANESYDKILFRFNQPETTYYFINADNNRVGVIRIVDFKGERRKRISPIFILPEYRNRGYAQQAIIEAERIFGKSGWELETILQEKGNCHLYEKIRIHKNRKNRSD